jgi:hypothetical protein
MRDRLGTPLIYDYKANVYRLQPMGQVGEKVEHFPGMWLSTDEAYAVLTMYNVMKLIDPGVLMRFMQPLRFPIKRMLTSNNFTMRGLDRKIKVKLPKFVHSSKVNLAPIFESLADDTQISISWKSGRSPVRSGMGVVQSLTFTESGWEIVFADEGKSQIDIRLSEISTCDVQHRIGHSVVWDEDSDDVSLKFVFPDQ